MLSKYVVVVGIGWLLVGCMALFAKQAGMLTTSQMQAKGIQKGINFENHGSTWWLLAVLVLLTGMLVGLYSDQWPKSWDGWKWKVVLAAVIAVFMQVSWTFVPYPDFMVARKWVPSLAAYPHMLIMCGYITVLLMTYLETPLPHAPVLAFTAMYTTWHVFVGNHMLQKANPSQGFPPYPFWDAGPISIICIVAVIMAGATAYALR